MDLFTTSEENLTGKYHSVQVEYNNGFKKLFGIGEGKKTRWVFFRKDIKVNLFEKGLCQIKGITHDG